MDNYRPGVTKKLGIDFESLSKINRTNRLLLDHRHRPVRSLCQAAGVRHRRPGHGRHDERVDGPEKSQAGRAGLRRLLERHVFGAGRFGRADGAHDDRQRPAGRRDDGRIDPGVLERAGDRNAGPWTSPRSVHPAAPVADLCVCLRRRRHAGDSLVLAAKILGRAVQGRWAIPR